MSTQEKVIYFDEQSYNQAIKELERYREQAKQLRELWYSEPLLQDTEFTYEHYTGLIQDGFQYLEQQVQSVARKQIETAMGAAAAKQFNSGMFAVVCDRAVFDELLNQLRKVEQGTYLSPAKAKVNCRMLEIRKTYPYISEQLKTDVRNKCSIFAVGLNSELFKAGVELETAYNKVYSILEEKYKGRHKPKVISKPGEKKPGEQVRAVLRADLNQIGKYRFSLDLLDYGLQ
jgi:hypothetical protein